MRDNLRPDNWTNTYYRVTEPFEVYVKVGVADSNTFIGRSQMLGNVYERRRLKAGDEVHAIAGGTFVVIDGEAWPASCRVADWHPFEGKYHGHEIDKWPLEKLQRTQDRCAPKYDDRSEHTAPGRHAFDRNIDTLRD